MVKSLFSFFYVFNSMQYKGKISLKKYLIYFVFVLFFIGHSINSLSQVDKEFWFVVPELSHRGNTGGTPGTLRIATMELESTVTISMPANEYHPTLNPNGFQPIVVDIAGNSTAAVDLTPLIDVASNPSNNRLENKVLNTQGINDFGLHITATNMITVYWEVNYDFGADLWTLKGSNALGTLFYTPFQTVYNNRNLTPRTYSAIDIVATEDNTQITITLPPGIAATYGTTNIPPGATYIFPSSLGRGQTLSVFPYLYSILGSERLAGTKIESTEPIAVTVKDDALASGSQGQDAIGDQLVPVDIVGDIYIVPEINNPNHVYVVATEDNTNLYVYDALGLPIGSTPYATLNAGEQELVIVPGGTKYNRITSRLNAGDPAKPFYVFQMGIENQSRGGALVPPIGCTGNTQLAFTRARADNKFYFFIIVERGNEDKFLIDGVRDDGIINPGAFTEILGSGGWVALFTNSINSNILTVGQHLVQNTGGIFHLGVLNGFPGASRGRLYYGYYSDFGGLNIGANVAGTNSSVVRTCYGSPVQLYAYGGTNYQWTPDTYLDDATLNRPTAINLPPGPHNYTVEVSGGCGSGTFDLTVLVAPEVVAFFEPSATSGCSPLEIVFNDQSSGEYSWQYDFGDTLIKYDLDPATLYPQPPNYPNPFSIARTYINTTNAPITDTITLLVKNQSGCSDIYEKTIVTYPEIHSDFSVDVDRGCEPLLVQFQNNSYGDTASWVWEFGDGGSSIESSPQHTYTNLFGPDSLQFEAQLIAISPHFCRDTSTHTITVMPYIEANFAFDTVSACTPHEIIISDQSFGADSYFWDFGDGTTSTSPGPKISKIFVNNTAVPDTFTISLRVENDEGCVDSISREVIVYPEIIADFFAAPDEECSPFEVIFQNNSSGAATYFWDFGDGGTSIEVNPIHLYDRNLTNLDTTFTVMLVATSAEFCRDTAYFDILVHPYIEAAFTVEDIIGCTPFTISIDNESIGVDLYEWVFGDGNSSNTSAASFTHEYINNTGATVVYQLQLVVHNTQGCSDTLVRNITVHPEITANWTADIFQGCHPLTVTFTDLSVNAINYLWDFGDGSSSVIPEPVHTYNNLGTTDTTYTVTLTTSTADGECVKSVSWPILVHAYVEAEFTFPKALDCNPFEVTFDNLSVGGLNYTWDFGDGTVLPTINPGPVTHNFVNTSFTNIQDFEVILLVENYAGCTNEARKTVSVYPDIISDFDASDTIGCHPFEVSFINLSNGVQTYIWNFGDGSFSNQTDPTHTFTNTGTVDSIYTVILITIASNNLCRDTSFIDITVHPYILANFTIPENLGCNPFDVSLENSSINAIQYDWDFGDGTDTITFNTNPFIHRFNNSDFNNQRDYEIILVAENAAGCTSEIRRTITVEPDIIADFSANQVQGCHPLDVDFTNLSNGTSIFHWDFGNGTTSQLANPSHTFTNIGAADTTYRVWLYATANNLVCQDSFFVDIVVHPFILADFTFQENIQCSPSRVQFNNASVGGDTFNWDFGDGSDTITADMNPISHLFNNTSFTNFGTFQVSLVAENNAGCTSQIIKTVEVYPAIQASFSSSVDEGCHPLEVDFTNQSNGEFTYAWNLGDGASSEAESPGHTFTNFTDTIITRQVILVTTSRYNCVSEDTMYITIHPKPLARFETDMIIDCPPFNVAIGNTSLNADNYAWVFGDGNVLNTTFTDTINHIYDNLTGDIVTYELQLVASSTFGCADSTSQKLYVYPATIADFTSNDEGCSPLTVYFDNLSVRGETYLWDFGDGSTITVQDPTNIYFNFSANDTVFPVILTSTSKYGCVDTYSDSVYVYLQPDAEFLALPTHQTYPDATIEYTNVSSLGNWSYEWDMGDGFITNQEHPDDHTYSTWGSYEINLYVSSTNCSDQVAHTIRIFPGPPIAGFDSVPPGCVPQTIQFHNTSLYGDTYLWDFDDGTTSTEFEPEHTFPEHGIYNVKLSVTGEGGIDYAYHQVEVYRNPFVDFLVSPQLVMLPDQEIQLFNLSEYGETYLWNFGDGSTSTDMNPRHLYSKIGTFHISLDVWTEHGCTDRLVIPSAVTVLGKGLIIFPNAFKPDMSGPNGGYYDIREIDKNNIFHPYWEGVEEYFLEIYNKWGELLYTSDDVMKGWDGYYREKLSKEDVYVWKCWGIFSNGRNFLMAGDVTLLHDDHMD